MSKQPTIPAEEIERRAREVMGAELKSVEIKSRIRRSEKITIKLASSRLVLTNDSYRDPDAVRKSALMLFNQMEFGAAVAAIQLAVPAAHVAARESPCEHDGPFWADAHHDRAWVVLQWSPRHSGTWGVTNNSNDQARHVFPARSREPPAAEHFWCMGEAIRRVTELLASDGGDDGQDEA